MATGREPVAVCRLFAAVLAALAAASLTLGAAQSGPTPAGNKTAFVVALDGADRPVTDLTTTDVRVAEDGVDRPIADLKTATEPIDLTLVVDTSLSTQSAITQLRAALMRFTHTIFAGNRGAIVSVIDVAGAAVLVADRKETPEDVDRVLSKTIADRSLGAVILEGMSDAAGGLAKSRSLRRAIVVVDVDGIPDESGPSEQQRVVNHVLGSGASVWAVSYGTEAARSVVAMQASGVIPALVGASASDAGHAQNRDTILELVPARTGGLRRTVSVPTALAPALDQVAKALFGQYALTYARPDGPAPKQLQVRATRAGVKILSPTTPPR